LTGLAAQDGASEDLVGEMADDDLAGNCLFDATFGDGGARGEL
jgi:hypothetical protein